MFKKKNKEVYNKILNVALIGYGGMGGYHVNQITNLPFLKLAGIYDIAADRVEIAKKNGYHTFNNPEEIYNDKSIDLVVIVTPNEVHAPYVIACANAGKNVVCEKPATLSSALFNDMVTAVEKNNVKFMIHQNRRWDNDYLSIKNIYDNKMLGNVYNVESRVLGSNSVHGWRTEKEHGGGIILDWGVHMIDQMLQMIKKKVTNVFCKASYIQGFEVDDGFKLTLTFEDGTFANIEVDTNTFIKLPRWRMFGDAGTGQIDDWNTKPHMVLWKEKYDNDVKGIKAGNGLTKTMANRTKRTIIKKSAPRIIASWRSFYSELYNSIAFGKPLPIKTDEVMRVLKILEACFESSKTQSAIKVNI